MNYRFLIRLISLQSKARNFSTEAATVSVEEPDLTKSHVVVLKSGTVVCWHPDKVFPYDHSRPIDINSLKRAHTNNSVLDKDTVQTYSKVYRKGPKNQDLKEIFYTSKTEWFSRSREEKLYAVSAPIPKRKK